MRSIPIPVPKHAAWAMGLALAITWVAIGLNSDQVPWMSDLFWVAACGLAAGSALACARFQSMFALRSYVVITAVVGAIRSLAYISVNAGGPMSVWILVTITTVIAYELAIDKTIAREAEGGG